MKNKYFSIMPIGGVQEIGSNMTLVRTPQEDLIIDCGMLFPYEDCFDINYLVPDFSSIRKECFNSIIITHGHEDHIGGLAQLLKEFPDTTVYTTRFTLHLIQKKLEEEKIKINYKLYDDQSVLEFKEVDIYPVHVNHSIPETSGMIITSKDKTWGSLYISDFKVDLNSQHEKPIALDRIRNILGQCQHTAYFLDSTNILSETQTTPEGDLYTDLKTLINGDAHRIFITLFASNVHRLSTIAKFGLEAGRKIVFMGRSMKTYMDSAFETGHSDLSSDHFSLPEEVKNQSGRLLVFLSGCQGDFLSALRRFSFGEDSSFKPQKGDQVIFSSKVIPGNEKKIYRIYNKLTEFGAEVITASDYLIHASGHPGRVDLKIMLDNFMPNYYFPIHGESYLLKKHFDFITQNYPEISTHLIHNYQEVIFGDDNIKIQNHPVKEPRLIHGKSLEIEKTQISQRRKMATQGAVFLSFIKSNFLLEITFIGLPLSAEDLKEGLKKKLLDQIRRDLSGRDDKYFIDQLKISTRQYLNNFLGYKPVTEVHLF